MPRQTEPDDGRAELPDSIGAGGLDRAAGSHARVAPVAVRCDALLAVLVEPRGVKELAGLLGMKRSRLGSYLKAYLRSGRVVRVGYGRYLAKGAAGAPAAGVSVPGRPQPIRDAILAYLSEPRQAKQVAVHIGREVPNATGHLAAMGRLGLVVRTAYGRYERADLVADGARPAAIVRPHPVREAVRACLDRPMHQAAVAAVIGRSVQGAAGALRRMTAQSHAVCLGRGVFAPPGHGPGTAGATGHAVRVVRGDPGVPSSENAPCSP